jgi:hypothetical protein
MPFTGSQNQNSVIIPDGHLLTNNGYLFAYIPFITTSPKMRVIARGSYAGGSWPIMEVKIAGISQGTVVIDSSKWKTFEVKIVSKVTDVMSSISFAFINDYYGGTQESDRNLSIDKAIIIQNQNSGTFSWDANTEGDFTGYKIYYGKTSRFNPSLSSVIPDIIKQKCALPETGPLTENQEECKRNWEQSCPFLKDPMCNSDYFSYDAVIDVENVTQYFLANIPNGKYYFAATAYYDGGPHHEFASAFGKKFDGQDLYEHINGSESSFSVELSHTFSSENPNTILNLKRTEDSK